MDSDKIFETTYWRVTHRKDARFPGYLIVEAKSNDLEISSLNPAALQELGGVLARTEKLLISFFNPYRVISAKLGFSHGFPCHFHVLPVSNSMMQEIEANPKYTNCPDGNDVLVYASREYCERPLTTEEEGSKKETIKRLIEHDSNNESSRTTAVFELVSGIPEND